MFSNMMLGWNSPPLDDVQRSTLQATDTTSEYYGGNTVIAGAYRDGVQSPGGAWVYAKTGGVTNYGAVLLQHAAPAWLTSSSNMHSVAMDISGLNYGPDRPGFHLGLLSRHPGTNYVSYGDNRSSAIISGHLGDGYAGGFGLENIEFAPAGSYTRDPWKVGNIIVANGVWYRIEVHTRWHAGVASSRAVVRKNGLVIADSGWHTIGGSWPTTFSDLSRNRTGVFFVPPATAAPTELFGYRNVRSSWAAGDAAILTDL